MKTPSFRLDGKRALVTGGSKGIGLAAAHALVQAGAEVVIAARNAPELIAACADIMPASGTNDSKISYKILDVLDSRAVDQLFSSNSVFDIVINNAGTNRPKLIEDCSDED